MKIKLFLSFLIAAALMACGGGGGGGTNTTQTPPTITTQPIAASVYENSAATFSVNASDTGSLSYQWKKNGVSINGANSPSYTTPAVSLADNNSIYSVDVTGAGGTTPSVSVTLTVLKLAPSIVTAPTAQSVISGQTVQFSVTALGYPILTYQWYKNGAQITGATSASYSTSATIEDNTSIFYVKISNSSGSITSESATLTVQQSSLTDILISEVSSCYYVDIDCWFEIYNPTASSINLNNYMVKSYGRDWSNATYPLTTFTLPAVSIPSGGYAIISGNYSNRPQIGAQNIKIRNGSITPYWQERGFIEVLKAGSTVDFIVFGNISVSPTTSGKWNGASIAALPFSSTSYGKSIVRLYPRTADTNTYSSQDWTSVDWVTPAGRNDIRPDTFDIDSDGIPDSAEISGGTFAGIDLYAMGARTSQKDIFIEVDQMNSADPGVIVRKEALQKLVNVFSAKSIKIHFDAGNLFNSEFSVNDFNLGQNNSVVTYEPCVTFDQTTCSSNISYRRSLYDWKEEYMDLRRRSVFHYALFANSQLASGAAGSSGVAEFVGNDLIITLGGWGLTTNSTSNTNKLINFQASTLMHELGHNLGLEHGGNESTNYKPNYYSIMNYLYQLNGLDPDPKSITAFQRWRKDKGDGSPALCDLVASPCDSVDQFSINYSDGTSNNLIESGLSESANIGRGANSGAYADWNINGSLTNTLLSIDLNADSMLSTLTDHDDWSNLIFPFARNAYGNAGAMLNKSMLKPSINPITNDRQRYIIEYDAAPK